MNLVFEDVGGCFISMVGTRSTGIYNIIYIIGHIPPRFELEFLLLQRLADTRRTSAREG